jgi:hypothetical protein
LGNYVASLSWTKKRSSRWSTIGNYWSIRPFNLRSSFYFVGTFRCG